MQVEVDPPSYLTNSLGRPPTDGWPRDRWEGTAAEIEHHRLRWGITDPIDALGERGGYGRARRSRELLHVEIRRTVDDLHRDRAPQQELGWER